jgi:hypothetical protein
LYSSSRMLLQHRQDRAGHRQDTDKTHAGQASQPGHRCSRLNNTTAASRKQTHENSMRTKGCDTAARARCAVLTALPGRSGCPAAAPDPAMPPSQAWGV